MSRANFCTVEGSPSMGCRFIYLIIIPSVNSTRFYMQEKNVYYGLV